MLDASVYIRDVLMSTCILVLRQHRSSGGRHTSNVCKTSRMLLIKRSTYGKELVAIIVGFLSLQNELSSLWRNLI